MSNDMIKVGFIGLGRIGKPMAVNILKAGFDLSVYDLRAEPVSELAELGAKAAHSLKEVAEGMNVIELAVVDDTQVEEALVGHEALIDGAGSGTIVVIHSTVHPETVKRVAKTAAAKGVHVIDAPISGGETGARERSLCYMVGGEQTLVERCREVFSTSASEIFHMGALGSGAAAKMIVQVVTCINMLAAHEAEVLADRSGLNFAALQKVMRVSSAQSFVADQWIDRFKLPQDPIEIRRKRTEVFQKSLAPAIETAQRFGLSLSGAILAERLLPQIMGIEEP
jgi:3-hydroxyisobutyrate dehydrogenase-like beta-hydroxyacid dehydrogenase